MRVNLYPGKRFLYSIMLAGVAGIFILALQNIKGLYEYTFAGLFWWQAVLTVIGIVAILTTILNLFSSFGDHTKNLWATKTEALNSDGFMQSAAHLSESPEDLGGPIEILNNGDEFLASLLKEISTAQSSINLSVYIWEDGVMSDKIFEALAESLKKGVEVRILLDGFGSMFAPRAKFKKLRMAGARVEKFRTAQFGKLTRLHRRNHRRAMVIDGLIGFTGGMAVGDKWLGNALNKHQWRDMMFKVSGKMAQNLQGAFAQLWASTNGEILTGNKFYPPLSLNTFKNSRYLSLASSPSSDTEALPKLLWMTIASAQKKLYIVSPYFVPDRLIRKALMDRAYAGVDVRLMMPNHFIDGKPIRAASHYYYYDFLRAGVKIYEYQAARLHSKFLVVDSIWSIIGSANMDHRSVQLNEENIFGIQEADFAQKMESVFLADVKLSKEIKLEEWEKRGLLKRAAEFVCARFVKQF